jgi:hypothetical protein
MTKLDSIKVKVPNDCILGLGDRFITTNIVDAKENQLQNKSSLTTTGVLGFKSAIVDNRQQQTIFEFSAKILGADYFEGIHLGTIQQVADTINNSKLLTIDPYKFIESAEVLKLDATDNLRPEITGEKLYNTLALLPISKKYKVTHYESNTTLGIEWWGQQKTKRDRMILYDKTKDLIRDKELRKQPYAVKVFNDFKDVVRVESNHAQLKSLRQLYGSTNLLDILGSNARVNYQRFTSITAKTTDIRLFTEFDGMKWNEIVKREGFRGICERCNMDWFLIDRFIRIHNTHNYRGVRPELRAYYNTLNQNTRIVEFDVIQHIKDLLLVA